MRKQLIAFGILLHFAVPVTAQVNFGMDMQMDNVSISLSTYPDMVRVPGYPVYYASGLNSNYFFYDGMYWIFETDRWYSSNWYNGPWASVDPEFVPLYLLRVPVRYFRRPPAFFVGWQANSPPRWGEHWGNTWAKQRAGWDRWNRRAMPAPAPLPTYQRKYFGDRYPSRDQQPILQKRNYRHEARDPLVRQQSNGPGKNAEPPQRGRSEPSVAPRQATPRQEAPPPPRKMGQPGQGIPREEERPTVRSEPRPDQQRRQPLNGSMPRHPDVERRR